MSYRNGTYVAFYVDEPFCDGKSPVTAFDFCYYNLLKAWKETDPNFDFIDSHEKTYQVRDDSDFNSTLVPRIRERLKNSKNMILFLSSHTKQSKALKEEIEYGAIELGLPIIVVYPEFNFNSQINIDGKLTLRTLSLIDNNLPVLRRAMTFVPTAHILLNKENINACIDFAPLTISGKIDKGIYTYKK